VALSKNDILTNDTPCHLSTTNLKLSRQSNTIFKIEKFFEKIHGVPSVKKVKNSVFYFSRSNGALYSKMSYLVKVAPASKCIRGAYCAPLTFPIFEIFMKIIINFDAL